MTITAKVIADSIEEYGGRITTFQLQYPRFIHAEFLTHRMFSRNASSSRAIPVEKQIQMIKEDTAMPIHWGMNQPGMQADKEQDVPIIFGDGTDNTMQWQATPQEAWCEARDRAIEVAEAFVEAGYHKQIVNRILEPFSHISVVVTSTQYDNFFSLRSHKDAQPEIKVLSDAMYAAREASNPRLLTTGEWHLPYVSDEELSYLKSPENASSDPVSLATTDLIKASVARCARVSYLTHDGKTPSMEKDLALYERLVGMVPLHASPAEHQAQATGGDPGFLNGNFHGNWIQYRKLLDGECCDNWGGPDAP